jgi:galactokinase
VFKKLPQSVMIYPRVQREIFMTGKEILNSLNTQKAGDLFSSLYGETEVDSARRRYSRLIEEFILDAPNGFPHAEYPENSGEVRIFSAPGRTELGGNHTDHNRGKVLAGSIQLDAAAVVAPRKDKKVLLRSTGYKDVKIDLSDLSPREEEKNHSASLIRGIAAAFSKRGNDIYGFTANLDNKVISGSGLSSSAAIEVLLAKIFDNLYCGGKLSALELAKIGQYAENVYFGKPCGLMDQTACASGGAVAINFADAQNPEVKGIRFDPGAAGFALCVVDSKGSHSDLTPDYAAIPTEMKKAAAFFGKNVLSELEEDTLMSSISELRKAAGDRAVLRAMHFYSENDRVDKMLDALENMNAKKIKKKADAMELFLSFVNESGDSSWELLQNIYSPKHPDEQGVSLALAITKKFLADEKNPANNQKGNACKNRGACRVHGGGFAGTIQAYIPLENLDAYNYLMEGIFGKGSLTVLRIRHAGAVEILF